MDKLANDTLVYIYLLCDYKTFVCLSITCRRLHAVSKIDMLKRSEGGFILNDIELSCLEYLSNVGKKSIVNIRTSMKIRISSICWIYMRRQPKSSKIYVILPGKMLMSWIDDFSKIYKVIIKKFPYVLVAHSKLKIDQLEYMNSWKYGAKLKARCVLITNTVHNRYSKELGYLNYISSHFETVVIYRVHGLGLVKQIMRLGHDRIILISSLGVNLTMGWSLEESRWSFDQRSFYYNNTKLVNKIVRCDSLEYDVSRSTVLNRTSKYKCRIFRNILSGEYNYPYKIFSIIKGHNNVVIFYPYIIDVGIIVRSIPSEWKFTNIFNDDDESKGITMIFYKECANINVNLSGADCVIYLRPDLVPCETFLLNIEMMRGIDNMANMVSLYYLVPKNTYSEVRIKMLISLRPDVTKFNKDIFINNLSGLLTTNHIVRRLKYMYIGLEVGTLSAEELWKLFGLSGIYGLIMPAITSLF